MARAVHVPKKKERTKDQKKRNAIRLLDPMKREEAADFAGQMSKSQEKLRREFHSLRSTAHTRRDRGLSKAEGVQRS